MSENLNQNEKLKDSIQIEKYKIKSAKEFNELKDSVDTLKAEYEAKLVAKDQEIESLKANQKLPSVKPVQNSMDGEPFEKVFARFQSLSGAAKHKFYEANKELLQSVLKKS